MIALSDKEVRRIRKQMKDKTHKELVDIIISMERALFHADIMAESLRNMNAFDPSAHRSSGGITLPRGA